MPAFTSIALATAAAASTGLAVHQSIEGAKMRDKAQEKIEDYQRQDLDNVYRNLDAPTESFNIRRDQIEQNVINQADYLASAGARGIVGGARALQTYSEKGFREIQSDFEQSQFRLQQMIAQDEARRQGMQEQREREDLAGLGSLYEAGRQDVEKGKMGVVQGLTGLAQVVSGFDHVKRIKAPSATGDWGSVSPSTPTVETGGGPGSQNYIDPNQFKI